MPNLRKLQWGSRLTELVIVAFGNLVAGLSLLIGVKLLSARLTPNNYANYALALTALTFFTQLLFGPIAAGAMRFVAEGRYTALAREYYAALKALLCKAIAVASAAALLAVIVATINSPSQTLLVLVASCAAVLGGASSVVETCLSAERKRLAVAAVTGGGHAARNGLAIAATYIDDSALSAMVGYSIGCIAQLMVSFMLLDSTREKVSIDATKSINSRSGESIWEYVKPFFIWGAVTGVFLISDRWSLKISHNETGVAAYAIAQQCVQQPVNFIFSVLFLFAGPHLYSNQAEKTISIGGIKSTIRRGTVFLLLLGSIVFLILSLFGVPILTVLSNPKYFSAAVLFGPVFLGTLLFQLGQWESQLYMVAKSTGRLLAPKIVTAVMGVGLNILGARIAGPSGVATAGIAVAVCYVVWIVVDSRKLAT